MNGLGKAFRLVDAPTVVAAAIATALWERLAAAIGLRGIQLALPSRLQIAPTRPTPLPSRNVGLPRARCFSSVGDTSALDGARYSGNRSTFHVPSTWHRSAVLRSSFPWA